MALTVFTIYEFYLIFSRHHPAVGVKYNLVDLMNDGKGIEPFNEGFDIAIGVTTRNVSLAGTDPIPSPNSPDEYLVPSLDPSIATIKAMRKTYKKKEQADIHNVELVSCEHNPITPYLGKSMESLLCLSDVKELSISGAPQSDMYSYIEVQVVQCTNTFSVTCKP